MQEDLISFFSEDINFDLAQSDLYSIWLQKLIKTYNKITGDISYIFCSDEYLHKLNVEHLNHDTLTDIITFDYTHAGIISGDIFISIDRIKENSNSFSVTFEQELTRVMAHGVLHLIGFKDKKQEEKDEMRTEEDKAISLFHLDL
ncbi:MAG: rRNA maturation RNase YbeY [Flavobacteriales bacterium]